LANTGDRGQLVIGLAEAEKEKVVDDATAEETCEVDSLQEADQYGFNFGHVPWDSEAGK